MGDLAWVPAGSAAVAVLALIAVAIGSDGRIGGHATLAWMSGSSVRLELPPLLGGTVLLAVEVAVLVVAVMSTWKARGSWPVYAVLLQSLAIGIFVAHLSDPRITQPVFERATMMITATALAALLWATWSDHRLRRDQLPG